MSVLCLIVWGVWGFDMYRCVCVVLLFVTQRQLMRLFAVKLILSYEQKFKVRSKFVKK